MRPPFDDPALRRELRDRLVRVPRVTIPDASLSRRPSIPLRLLADQVALEPLLAALDWFVGVVRGGEERQTGVRRERSAP